jgi:hypothetical protein
VSEWIEAMNNYLNQIENPIIIDREIYTAQEWTLNMNKIIQEAKISLS